MSYPCVHCNRDDGYPICLGDKRCLRTDGAQVQHPPPVWVSESLECPMSNTTIAQADPRWGTSLADEVLSELVEASGGRWAGEEFRITGRALCALLQAVYEGGIAAAQPPAA